MAGACVEESYLQNETCTSDTDCSSKKICVEGMCMIVEPCITEQCKQEEFCQEGVCLRDNNESFVPCEDDSNCREGFACSSLKICVDPYHKLHNCSEDILCGSKAQCRDGKCTSLPKPGKLSSRLKSTETNSN